MADLVKRLASNIKTYRHKGRSEKGKTTFTEKMKEKIDSVLGRMA